MGEVRSLAPAVVASSFVPVTVALAHRLLLLHHGFLFLPFLYLFE